MRPSRSYGDEPSGTPPIPQSQHNTSVATELSETYIRRLSQLRDDLTRVYALDEVKDIYNEVCARCAFLRVAGASASEYNRVVHVRIQTERKLGQILRSCIQRGGDQRSEHAHVCRDLLASHGIKPHESSRWQRMSRVPIREYNRLVAKATREGLYVAESMLSKLIAKAKDPASEGDGYHHRHETR